MRHARTVGAGGAIDVPAIGERLAAREACFDATMNHLMHLETEPILRGGRRTALPDDLNCLDRRSGKLLISGQATPDRLSYLSR